MAKKLPFKNRYLLAPMEGINDIAFRTLCKNAGAGMTWTGMVHPLAQQKINLNDHPVLQLFGNSEEGIREFVKKYDDKVCAWDFNLGCPAKLAKKHGFGSYLKDLNTIEKILKILKQSTTKPVGVKFRKTEIAFDILKIAEKYCDFISIHPRTQKQGYSGKSDLEFAFQIKKSTKLPVVYSGDVDEKNADLILKKFDYVAIGRNAVGRPQIFAKLIGKKFNCLFEDYFILAKKYKLPFRQLKLQAMNFTKDKKNAVKLRKQIFKIKDIKNLEKFVKKNNL